MQFLDSSNLNERIEMMAQFSKRFLGRLDLSEEGKFPYENINDLKESGYTSLTIPKAYGGKEISLYEMVRHQELIAEGDGSTALSIGWHMGIIKNLAEKRLWNENLFSRICEDVKKGALINSAATEPQTGSPTRGGKPQTHARKADGKWILNGHKTFTTMSPVLDYFIVSASIDGTDEIGNFLIHRNTKGLTIEETWDSVAMSGTGSHDLLLHEAAVDLDCLAETRGNGDRIPNGWLLHIPACYLGIAKAAQKYSIKFAREYTPNSLNGPIIDLPTVKEKIGQMELMSMQASHFLYTAAKEWDASDLEQKKLMAPLLGAVKYSITNSAIQIVDLAMRVVGARSLSAKNPLQRYYRDVRAGLHNPPMDDMTIQMLANYAIEKQK